MRAICIATVLALGLTGHASANAAGRCSIERDLTRLERLLAVQEPLIARVPPLDAQRLQAMSRPELVRYGRDLARLCRLLPQGEPIVARLMARATSPQCRSVVAESAAHRGQTYEARIAEWSSGVERLRFHAARAARACPEARASLRQALRRSP